MSGFPFITNDTNNIMKNSETGETAYLTMKNEKHVAYFDGSDVPWIHQFDNKEDLIEDLEVRGFHF